MFTRIFSRKNAQKGKKFFLRAKEITHSTPVLHWSCNTPSKAPGAALLNIFLRSC
jgi:hypothetical protein